MKFLAVIKRMKISVEFSRKASLSQLLSVKHYDDGRIGQIKSFIEEKCALTVYKGWQMSYLWLYHSTNNHGRMNLDNNHSVLGCQGPTWRRTIRCHRIKQKESSSEGGIQAHMSLCSIWSSSWRSYPLAMGLLCCWSHLRLMLQVGLAELFFIHPECKKWKCRTHHRHRKYHFDWHSDCREEVSIFGRECRR